MTELYETLLEHGVTPIVSVMPERALAPLQEVIYAHTRHLIVEHDPALPVAERVRLPFARPASHEDWLRLMRRVEDCPEKRALVDALPVVATFARLYGRRGERFPVSLFRAAFYGLSQSQVTWHQDAGTWYATRRRWLASKVPTTLWLSLNGADRTNSLEIAVRSHTARLLNHRFSAGQGVFRADVGRLLDGCERVRVACEAGQGIMFHPLTLHRTISPQSLRPRYSIDIRYFSPEHTARFKVSPRFRVQRWVTAVTG